MKEANYSIYQSFRKPDKDKDKANPWYKNPIDKLKQSYNKVDQMIKDSFMSKLYAPQLRLNPAYAANYNTSHNASDYQRKAQVSSGYKFRHAQP